MLLILGGLLFAFLLTVALLRARRRMQHARRSRDADAEPIFDLTELRAMRERGQITSEEFDRLRAIMHARREPNPDRPQQAKGFQVLPLPPPEGAQDPPDA